MEQEQQTCQLLLELEEKVSKLKQEIKNKEKEVSLLKDQQLAKMEHQVHLLTCLNELRCQQIVNCEEKLDVITLELENLKQELNMIYATLSGQQAGPKSCTGFCHNQQNNLDKMINELRCGVCSELMVLATSLNCMHTFCQYCVTKWKSESPTAGCPLCRDPGLFERRNFLVDNMIAIIVNLYSEKEQIIRKKFEKQRKELHRNLLADGLRTPNNPFYRITERGLVLGEMQIEELPSFTQVPSPVVSSSAMVTSIVRSLTRNPVISRERLDNRRRLHYTRMLVNIGRRRLMSRTNIFQSMPPCSPENIHPLVFNFGSSFGETALAFTCFYIALTFCLFYTLYYLQVL